MQITFVDGLKKRKRSTGQIKKDKQLCDTIFDFLTAKKRERMTERLWTQLGESGLLQQFDTSVGEARDVFAREGRRRRGGFVRAVYKWSGDTPIVARQTKIKVIKGQNYFQEAEQLYVTDTHLSESKEHFRDWKEIKTPTTALSVRGSLLFSVLHETGLSENRLQNILHTLTKALEFHSSSGVKKNGVTEEGHNFCFVHRKLYSHDETWGGIYSHHSDKSGEVFQQQYEEYIRQVVDVVWTAMEEVLKTFTVECDALTKKNTRVICKLTTCILELERIGLSQLLQ